MGTFPQIGDRFGSFRLTGQIGRGGMGVVFAAEQTGLGRTVALKVLAPEYAAQEDYRERFVREASVLARLDSPHVIHIYDHGERDGCLFIATQYVAGGDLGAALRRAGPCPVPEAAEIAAQMASALDDAHRAGVVHRDVKPNNVLLRDIAVETYAYLCDFGIAQAQQQGLTQAGSIAGTLAYMAPERCRGEAATPASDIYALGCVLWTALVGTAPYGGTDVEVGMSHLSEPVPQLLERDPVSAAINRILSRSMAKDPAARHPRAADLRGELRGLVATAREVGPVTLEPVRRPRSAGPAGPVQQQQAPSDWGQAAVPRGHSQPSQASQPSQPSQPSHPSYSSSAARPIPFAEMAGQGRTGGGSGASPLAASVPPPPESRTWIYAVAGILALALVLGVLAVVFAVRGNGDDVADPVRTAPSPSAAASPSASASASASASPSASPSASEAPSSDPGPPSAATSPAKPSPTPTYPDVAPAAGPVLQTKQVRFRAPTGWGAVDPGNLTGGAVGARDYNASDAYYPTVTLSRSKPVFPLSDLSLLEAFAKTREGGKTGKPGLTSNGATILPRAWLDGDHSVRVLATFDNSDGTRFFAETYYVQRGAWLYRLWFFASARLTRTERRALIDPVAVSWRWRG